MIRAGEVVVPLVIYRLPGGRFATHTVRDAARLSVTVGLLTGPRAWALRAAADSGLASVLERRWARAVVRALRIDLDIAGAEHIEPGRTYLVAPLHEGFADVAALLHLPLSLRFVARDELARWRVLGSYLRRSRHPLIDPEAPRSAVRSLLTAVPEAVDAGESLAMFPQGSILGIEVAFRHGVFHLADRFDLPVLPVVLTGSHQVWDHPFSPLVQFDQRVSLRVLPAVRSREAVRRAGEVEEEMKEIALGGEVAAPRRFDPARDGFWDDYRYEIDPRFPAVFDAVRRHRRLSPVVLARVLGRQSLGGL